MRFWLLITLMLLVTASAPRTLAATKEYEVKTAFIYNFAKFVEWPAGAFADAQAPLVIGAMEPDVISEALTSLTGKTAQGRKITVRLASNASELRKCQVVFISTQGKRFLSQILAAISGLAVLVITEEDTNFGADGVMINLISVEDKVRFEINNHKAQQAGLKISSQLLKLAHDVRQ